jgi:hypothetical protein
MLTEAKTHDDIEVIAREPGAKRKSLPPAMQRIGSSDLFVAAAFLALFVALTWRLFAFGSSTQLYLYGDNLTALNNLFYLFEHFDVLHPFATYIGENGMNGSYPMAEPQNSIFYPPLFAAFLVSKLVGVSASSVYYSLLIVHALHTAVGAYFVFRIANRHLGLVRSSAFLAGAAYIGLGWNVGWFGTNTLSYMTGVIPVTLYLFLSALKRPGIRSLSMYTLSLALLLYAGGAVNYFFYAWLNSALLFVSAFAFRVHQLAPPRSTNEVAKGAGLLLFAAPLGALAIYAVQLVATTAVGRDITREEMRYDDVSLFGLHFGDLVGVLLPKFGMDGFGTATSPTLDFGYASASLLYVGMVPILALAAAFLLRSRISNILVIGLVVNGLLAFGGMFVLYDATLLFPENSSFRGHYKYLTVVGVYLALLTAVVVDAIRRQELGAKSVRRLLNFGVVFWFSALMGALLLGIGALIAHNSTDPDVTSNYSMINSGLHQLGRTVLVLGGTLVALFLLQRYRTKVAVTLLAAFLLLDTSINNKLLISWDTPVESLGSDTFFECCEGKTVYNAMDGLTQLFTMPEVLGVNAFPVYGAIGNKYATNYASNLVDASNQPSAALFRSAGIDGVLTTGEISSSDFELKSSVRVDEGNFRKYFHYNPEGTIQETWGGRPELVGMNVRYYELRDKRQLPYAVSSYLEEPDQEKAISFLQVNKDETPIVTGTPDGSTSSGRLNATPVEVLSAAPTSKRYDASAAGGANLLVTSVPYSRVWKATVDGKTAEVVRANYAFSAVELPQGAQASDVRLYVDTLRMNLALLITLLSLAAVVCAAIAGPRIRRKSLEQSLV